MTTVVGIESRKKGSKHGIVLASDLSGTRTDWRPVGDVAYREQRRHEMQKIYVDDDKRFAFCMSGVVDKPWIDFCSMLRLGKIKVEDRLKEGFFQEFKGLNEYRWEGKIPDNDLINNMLIASRFENTFGLYTCFPMGKVEPRSWTYLGSGSKYAFENLQKRVEDIPHYLSLKDSLDLAVESLDSASQDIYTGGLDIVVVTRKGIQPFGELIREDLKGAKEESLRKMKREM